MAYKVAPQPTMREMYTEAGPGVVLSYENRPDISLWHSPVA